MCLRMVKSNRDIIGEQCMKKDDDDVLSVIDEDMKTDCILPSCHVCISE